MEAQVSTKTLKLLEPVQLRAKAIPAFVGWLKATSCEYFEGGTGLPYTKRAAVADKTREARLSLRYDDEVQIR